MRSGQVQFCRDSSLGDADHRRRPEEARHHRRIVPEPPGGAHSDPQAAADLLVPFLERSLKELQKLKPPQLLEERYKKFRRMGVFEKG